MDVEDAVVLAIERRLRATELKAQKRAGNDDHMVSTPASSDSSRLTASTMASFSSTTTVSTTASTAASTAGSSEKAPASSSSSRRARSRQREDRARAESKQKLTSSQDKKSSERGPQVASTPTQHKVKSGTAAKDAESPPDAAINASSRTSSVDYFTEISAPPSAKVRRAKSLGPPRMRRAQSSADTDKEQAKAEKTSKQAVTSASDASSGQESKSTGLPRCDRCDGPHESKKCPHFKKPRPNHKDARTNLGRSKSAPPGGGNTDAAPIVKNARVVPQPGDGSCLFHALSFGLQDNSSAQSLRKDISDYIAKHPSLKIADTSIKDWVKYDSGGSTRDYSKKMKSGTWGGGIEMAALTKMKNVNVHVYEKCREGYKRISAFESPKSQRTVNVIYQGRMHYDAIVL